LSSSILHELSIVLDKIEEDDDTKVIVLHGEGKFFSAGADIKEFTSVESGEDFSALSAYGQRLFDRMETFRKPIIAAIQGAALGGGLELAMACHLRIAAEGAKLGLPELQLGLVPGFAGTQRLPRFVGGPKACEMLLTSEPILAEEAAALGFINRVVKKENLFDEAIRLAKKIAEKSAVSVSYALKLLNDAKNAPFYQGVAHEAELFGKVFMSHDGQEGIQAFLEKRKPEFKDK
jgi:enoyl-CoA hydratase